LSVDRLIRTVPGWCVHLYTASSAVFGLWAVHAIYSGEYRLAIYLMLMTMVIDSTDGMWARAVDVRTRIPFIDGRRLDDICDYFTYVLVPALFLIAAGLLPHPAWAAAPVIASGYGFSQTDAKTSDYFFKGFPSYWNVVAMYLYLMGAAPSTALWIVLGFSLAVFLPIRFIYPTQTRVLRPVSLAMMGLWALTFSWASLVDSNPAWLYFSLIVGPGYYLGLSLCLNLPAIRARLPNAETHLPTPSPAPNDEALPG